MNVSKQLMLSEMVVSK